ncbi:cyclin-dependent kinase 4 inhibitor C [Pholidichthys leucotaenia]
MLGNTGVIEALLQAGADPDVPDPSCGLTVTHDGAREGFVNSVSSLVNHGADVNLADNEGNLPLHLAAREGHVDVVRLLVGHTTNADALNGQGRTARQLAADNRKTETAEYIQQYLDGGLCE